MAEKGFGVKEINLIGASGTPTIESPNNLNLNAVNVAISTNVSIGGTLTVSGNISIGGTLTYEDVTNIDSVGIITAQAGINVSGGNINLGDSANTSNHRIFMGADNDMFMYHNGTHGVITNTTGNLHILDDSIKLQNSNATTRLEVHTSGVTVTGTLTATTFSGSGASLTNLPAANLTGTLPAISGANLTGIAVTEAPVTDYTITSNGSSAYRFHGGGVDETANNPDLYLIRGQKYRFNNTTGSGHPFAIREANGGSAYTNGVTGNNQGVQFFTVPYDAPAKIFYQCTIHGGMVGNIYIRGANGQNDNVGITTFSSIVSVSGVTNLSGELRANGNIRITNAGPKITFVDSDNDSDFHVENANGSFEVRDITNGADRIRIASDGTISTLSNVDMNIGTGEVDIYSTGSGDQLSLRLLNSDASAGNKIGIYFGPANNVAGAYIKGVAESDFTSAANRDAGLEFGTRLNATFLAPLKISASGLVTKPLTPAFNVKGGNMTRSDTSGYICQFNNKTASGTFDNGNNFNTSTYKFVAPVSGHYYFFTNIRLDSFNSGYIRTAILSTSYNTNTTYYTIPSTGHVITYADNGSIQTVQTSTVMYLAVNQEAWVYQNPNSDSSFTCYLNESSFGGYLIG